MQVDGATGAASLHRKIKFGCAKFHVVAPFILWVEAERRYGKQVSAWRGVGQIENVLSGRQALVRISRVACLIFVVAKREVGGQSACQIGTDQRARLYLA